MRMDKLENGKLTLRCLPNKILQKSRYRILLQQKPVENAHLLKQPKSHKARLLGFVFRSDGT